MQRQEDDERHQGHLQRKVQKRRQEGLGLLARAEDEIDVFRGVGDQITERQDNLGKKRLRQECG